MLVQIPKLLDADEIAKLRERLVSASWIDGRTTSGPMAAKVKSNQQLAEESPEARDMGTVVMRALERNQLFMAAALPRHVYPPMFNKYEPGMTFGAHIDNAIRQIPGSPLRLRTDISATLFLSNSSDYEGGELLVEDTYGAHSVKLNAGDLILYPSTSLHRVASVTRGTRLASFFWVQSLIPEDSERTTLFELDRAIVELTPSLPAENVALLRLTATYHNLVRKWTVM